MSALAQHLLGWFGLAILYLVSIGLLITVTIATLAVTFAAAPKASPNLVTRRSLPPDAGDLSWSLAIQQADLGSQPDELTPDY